jgi:hypothetical protein
MGGVGGGEAVADVRIDFQLEKMMRSGGGNKGEIFSSF